jgi:hypothetical protein
MGEAMDPNPRSTPTPPPVHSFVAPLDAAAASVGFRSALLHSALIFRTRRSCPFSCYSATTGRGASQ